MEDKDRVKGEETEEESTSVLKEVLSWVFSFALALLVAILLKNYVVINADVPTGSMENTIMPGDRLVGNRLAYMSSEPERGDVVIFRYPDNEEELFVKRVIGLPGETVDIEDGVVYINGEALDEDYVKEYWGAWDEGRENSTTSHFEVPQDCYLMLGDNRNDSKDARYWTNSYVEKDKILAKAELIYWPLSDFGKVD
jgi:signal peptidase I